MALEKEVTNVKAKMQSIQETLGTTLIEKSLSEIKKLKNEVAADAFLPNKMHLRVMLDESQVCVYTNTRVISLTEDSVLCQNDIGDSIVVTTDVESPMLV